MDRVKYLIFDVDNTVTEDLKELSEEMSRVLENTRKTLVFVSGTNVPELERMLSSKLTRKHHLLGNTGTHYVTIENGTREEISKDVLSPEEKTEIIEAIEKLKEEYDLIPLTSSEDQIQDRDSQITLSILGRHAPPEMKNGYDPDKKKRIEFADYLKKMLGEEKYDINIGGTTSLDITKKGRDKCWAVKRFLELNGLEIEEVIFFGDQMKEGGNDYPVTKTGVKCVEVKNSADTLAILQDMYVLNEN